MQKPSFQPITNTLHKIKSRHLVDFLYPHQFFQNHSPHLGIPAYFFHQIEYQEFKNICKYIKSRGVRTLTFNDLLQENPPKGLSVLITFDDGWSSAWSIAFPLAQQYGIRFTLFLTPKAVENSEEYRTNINNCPNIDELIARDYGPQPMLTWGEVNAMHKSGLVEIQSHSFNHGVIFTSAKLSGFSTPQGPFPLPGNIPLISRIDRKDVVQYKLELGTPLYQWGPALSVKERFIENSEARTACIEYVERNGGSRFFTEEGWKDKLLNLIDHMEKGHWESQEERNQRYRRDLLHSKIQIEKQLPGASVRALAPPWAVMHPDLPSIAKEIGYEIIVLGYPFHHIQGSQLPLYPRLFGDAIWNLIDRPILGSIKWLRARRRNISRRKKGAIP